MINQKISGSMAEPSWIGKAFHGLLLTPYNSLETLVNRLWSGMNDFPHRESLFYEEFLTLRFKILTLITRHIKNVSYFNVFRLQQ